MTFVSDDPRNSPNCPNCRDGRGTPTSVEAFNGRTTIEFRCPSCGFVWQDVRDSVDRRRTV